MTSFSEDEQLTALRDWWQRNGLPLVAGAVIGLVGIFGWLGWQKYQTNQAQGASALYQQLLESSLTPNGQSDAGKVSELVGQLKSGYAGTAYAQYGSLFLAKVAVESGKLDDAAAELKAVLDKPADAAIGELARQRLARVTAAQGKVADALKLLDGDVDQAWLASREELKGDLLVKLGRGDDARAAYEKAKAALPEDAAVGGLQIKLDDLAKGDA